MEESGRGGGDWEGIRERYMGCGGGEGETWRVRMGESNGKGGNGKGEMGSGQQEAGDGKRAKGRGRRRGKRREGFHVQMDMMKCLG